MAKNYYLILDVTGDATQEQIKSAYRQKAKELHPDYYGENREPFLSVQEAYAVLIDPEQRRAHDEALERERRPRVIYRREPEARRHPKVEPLIPEERPSHIEDLSLSHSFRSYEPSFEELFERIWSNFSILGHPKAEKPENLTLEILLSPDEARRGGRVRISLPARQTCPVCRGRGGIGPFDCRQCNGEGALSGDIPVEIRYPPGIADGYITQRSLDSIGLHNIYLSVYFRVSE